MNVEKFMLHILSVIVEGVKFSMGLSLYLKVSISLTSEV